MRRKGINEQRVLVELADIAFADLREGELPVKAGDKLRALELIYKYLGMGEGEGGDEGVVIVDEAPAAEKPQAERQAPHGKGEGVSKSG